jgi:tetratricopeptide (TPR) repeat protein
MKTLITSMSCLLLFTAAYSQSDSSTVYFQKGVEEMSAKRYLVASNYLDKAVQINPKYEEAYMQDAYVNLQMKRTDAAMALFQKVYEMDPENTDAIKQLTDLYFNYHQYEKAMEFAKKCKTCTDGERVIAMCNYEQEDYASAITGLQNVLAKKPNDAEANYTIARSYLEMEEEQKAIPYYQTAINADPTKTSWVYELGIIYYDNRDYGHAIDMFNKAADNGYAKTSDFVENLGYAYIYTGDFEKGEAMLLSILAKKPNDKVILRDLAEAYYKHKMYDKALAYCQKLMEMDMKDAKALYQAGLCFQKKGNDEQGKKMCDQAIEWDPSLASLKQKQGESMGL